MIRSISETDIPNCAEVIRKSFKTVADELGFTPENAPRFTAFAVTEERLTKKTAICTFLWAGETL